MVYLERPDRKIGFNGLDFMTYLTSKYRFIKYENDTISVIPDPPKSRLHTDYTIMDNVNQPPHWTLLLSDGRWTLIDDQERASNIHPNHMAILHEMFANDDVAKTLDDTAKRVYE